MAQERILREVTGRPDGRTPDVRLLVFLVLAACDGPTSLGDPLDDPQLPPRGSDDVMTWIEAGHYLAWT